MTVAYHFSFVSECLFEIVLHRMRDNLLKPIIFVGLYQFGHGNGCVYITHVDFVQVFPNCPSLGEVALIKFTIFLQFGSHASSNKMNPNITLCFP